MLQNEPPICFLLGLPFHQTTMEETLADCDRAMSGEDPSFLVTANVDFVAQAHTDQDLQRILFHARRVVCDGMPLVWLSRMFGIPLSERITGSDMVFHLFENCSRDKRRVFFLGSDEDTLAKVSRILADRYPGLEIAGWVSPPVAPIHDWPNEEILDKLKQSMPHLLLVAVGCPKQERWIFQHFREAGVPLSIGIGASLDFISGKQVRAPKWMQKTGLEWIWRLMTDPKRLAGRYWKDFKYLFLLTFKQALIVFRRPGRRYKGASSIESGSSEPSTIKDGEDYIRIEWVGAIQSDSIDQYHLPENLQHPVLCDVSRVDFIDSSGIGLLVKLKRLCQNQNFPCAFLSPDSQPVGKLVKSLRLEKVLPTFTDNYQAMAWLANQINCDVVNDGEITLKGDLDSSTIDNVLVELSRQVDMLAPGELLKIPCAELNFIDSYAVGRLLSLKKMATARGGDLLLVNPSEQVQRILSIMRLQGLLFES